MVDRVKRVRSRRAARSSDNRNVRVQMEYVDLTDIQPYEFNPRDNAPAIESVANSMKSFGPLVPIVVDAQGILVAGHTRVEAAKTLGLTDLPCIRAEHLTEEQIRAFRVIDNKVSELSKWDFGLLAGEISALREAVNFTDFGWSREELDCLTDIVSEDCLSGDGLIDAESRERSDRAERRAPSTTRFVLGELVFFIPTTQYRHWVDGLRNLHDFNESAILDDVKRRLGVLDSPAT